MEIRGEEGRGEKERRKGERWGVRAPKEHNARNTLARMSGETADERAAKPPNLLGYNCNIIILTSWCRGAEGLAPDRLPELEMHPEYTCWENDCCRFRIVVYCQVLAELMNGMTALTNDWYCPILRKMTANLVLFLEEGLWPPKNWDDPISWR